MNSPISCGPVEILLVEDNPGDIRLTQEALKEGRLYHNLRLAKDGEEALAMLHRQGVHAALPLPDIIFLDLNLPRIDGRDVLARIKEDEELKMIPVVVLTSSGAEADILKVYNLHANCYVTKPVDLDQFMTVVKAIESFWLTIVKMPSRI
jgi:CheY-like chemotaxis protein